MYLNFVSDSRYSSSPFPVLYPTFNQLFTYFLGSDGGLVAFAFASNSLYSGVPFSLLCSDYTNSSSVKSGFLVSCSNASPPEVSPRVEPGVPAGKSFVS